MKQGDTGAQPTPVVERVRELTPGVLEMLHALVVHSHWNQVGRDWALFHSQGTVFAVRDAEQRIVASGAVLPMTANPPAVASTAAPGGVAWISMILVTPAARGRGLGRWVFEHCVRQVQGDGRIAMLDATPQGEPLYRQFGFEALWRLTRWRREARPLSQPLRTSATPSVETMLALDRQAVGFDRRALLLNLLQRPDTRWLQAEQAFAILRTGRVAQHIGPLVAGTEAAAIELLEQICAGSESPLLIDAPDNQPALRQALVGAGFQPQRGFARMAQAGPGAAIAQARLSWLHAIAGPEYG